MICVTLSGDLGNQMFQYACGRAIVPKQWFANEKLNAQAIDLVPPKWIRL